ncbi:DUF2283 domain-containing protein [Egbenema bharatensis]|uniref:DUF2283 domain-containing protein n=1 Tax=Egbenema bharatensis TaxID=3463334 RepID=UPI003A88D81A
MYTFQAASQGDSTKMRIQDSSSTDTLTIELTSKPIAATDAITDDLILDYDSEGKVIAIKTQPIQRTIEYLLSPTKPGENLEAVKFK